MWPEIPRFAKKSRKEETDESQDESLFVHAHLPPCFVARRQSLFESRLNCAYRYLVNPLCGASSMLLLLRRFSAMVQYSHPSSPCNLFAPPVVADASDFLPALRSPRPSPSCTPDRLIAACVWTSVSPARHTLALHPCARGGERWQRRGGDGAPYLRPNPGGRHPG